MLTRRDWIGRMAAAGALAGAAPWPRPWQRAQDPTHPTYVDGLCLGPLDDEVLRQSGLSALLLDVSAGTMLREKGKMQFRRGFDMTLRKVIDTRRKLRASDVAFLATRGEEVKAARAAGRVAVYLQCQGCEVLDGQLWRLDALYELGLRVLQITHHHDNPFGGGALMAETSGLTELGRECVAKMNELGVIPDLAHASDVTARDVLEHSSRPVVISHGAARALVDNPRCAPDDVLRAVGESGGVVGVFMMSCWLTTDPVPKPEHLVEQLRHIEKVAGLDAVAIANDFQVQGNVSVQEIGNDNEKGGAMLHPWWKSIHDRGVPGYDALPRHVVIPELNDVRRMFSIQRALERAGYSAAPIEKIMGGNWIRVLNSTLA